MSSAGPLDMTGLQSEYVNRPTRGVRRLWVGVVVLQLALQVFRLSRDVSLFSVVITVLFFAVFGLGALIWLLRPPTVALATDALRVRRFLRPQIVPWGEVREIQVQTRWQNESSAVLVSGRTIPLTAVPVQDAQRLAEALTDARG